VAGTAITTVSSSCRSETPAVTIGSGAEGVNRYRSWPWARTVWNACIPSAGLTPPKLRAAMFRGSPSIGCWSSVSTVTAPAPSITMMRTS